MGRKAVVRQDVSCPSCGSHHVVKCGRPLGRQRYLCRDCGKYFLGDATYHHHSKKLREEALRMYANGMSMRAIFRLNVPLGTVFSWIKRYGRQKYEKLVELWGRAKELVKGKVVTKVVMRCGLTCTRILELFTSGFSLVTCTQSWEFTSFTLWGIGMRVLSLRSKSICPKRVDG